MFSFKKYNKEEYKNQDIQKHDNKIKKRNFIASVNSRLQNWAVSYQRINADLKTDAIQMVLRSRELAKNNDFVSGYLNLMQRNVIGETGFKLQVQALNIDNSLDSIGNSTIERLWKEYNHKGNITLDSVETGRDLDILILRTLLIDGEVFIRKVYDDKSKFVIKYEVLDSLDVDYLYNSQNYDAQGNRVICGIKVDKNFKPISYFVRVSNTDYYNTGERIEISADDIIHIYRKYFPSQVRGYTALASTILNLNQLDCYKEAEIIAARLNACNQAFYVQNQSNGDLLEEADDEGVIATEYSPGTIRFAPQGYQIQQLQNNHPSSNFGSFVKNILRSIANSVGASYNKATSDYESVNYNSLRESALEDRSSWKELQQFLIDNWKNIQYELFLKYALLNNLTNIPFSRYNKFLNFKFSGRTWDWVDHLKDLNAIKLKLDLKLSDPISEIEKQGKTVDEVLDRWVLWNNKIQERGLTINNEDISNMILDDVKNDNIEDLNNEE